MIGLVLSGGASLGAIEVGMLHALYEHREKKKMRRLPRFRIRLLKEGLQSAT